MVTIEVTVYRTGRNFSAHMEEIPGIVTAADTFDGIKKNMWEAIKLHVETLKQLGNTIPVPLKGAFGLVFRAELEPLVQQYEKIFTTDGIATLSYIHPKTLQKHLTGEKKLKQKDLHKIESVLHKLGAELLSLQL